MKTLFVKKSAFDIKHVQFPTMKRVKVVLIFIVTGSLSFL